MGKERGNKGVADMTAEGFLGGRSQVRGEGSAHGGVEKAE